MKIKILLSLLVFLGAFIRLVNLGSIPAGFHEDEAHIGYNAYSLLKTAHDKNGMFLPLAIDQFGDFRPAGLHYLTIPSIKIFGLTEFAIRLPVAIIGIITILLFYFLTCELFQNKIIALIGSATITVNPWHIIASRSTSESIVALFFVLLGSFLILRAMRSSKLQFFLMAIGFLSYAISFLFYHSARYFVPFLIIYLGCLTIKINKIRNAFIGLSILLIFLLLLLVKYSNGGGRISEISIFSMPTTQITLWEQKKEDLNKNPYLINFFHNKIIDYTYEALSNYGKHFTPDFLFFIGGLPPRYRAPWNGNFYPTEAILFIVGFSTIITIIFQKKETLSLKGIPLVWLLAGPIPAALTFEDIPHFQRAIMMLSGFIWISSYGLYILYKALSGVKRQIIITILSIFLIYNIATFMHDYFQHTNTHKTLYRNEGEKQLVLQLKNKYSKNNVILTTQNGNRLIFYLFFEKIDPLWYQQIGSPRDKNKLIFQNKRFVDADCPSYSAHANDPLDTIYVDKGDCLIIGNVSIISSIYRPDNSVAFRFLKYKPNSKLVF